MAKGTRGRRRIASRPYKTSPYPMHTCGPNGPTQIKSSITKPIKDWEDITCSVCMEYPHDAVLLLCSSHNSGCRPYMCGTSSRYSNCLDQYTKAMLCGPTPELACPLCRGQVKGWTVVESTREYLNAKKRSCMHDDCSFVGVYKELRKHVRTDHPCANPREVHPDQEQKWRRLERDRERDDVISTITSSNPGSVVVGDYVIERGPYGPDSDNDEGFDFDPPLEMGTHGNLVNMLLLFHAFGHTGGDGGNSDGIMSLVNRLRRQGRVLLGRSGRRMRHRVVNRDQT